MALIQTYLLTGNVVMLAVRAASGFLTPAVGWGYLYGLGGVAIGTMVGGMVFERIPQRSFRYVVYGYIAVSGIVILATL